MEDRQEGRKQDTGNKSGGYYISPRKRSCKPGLGMWQQVKSLASDGGLNNKECSRITPRFWFCHFMSKKYNSRTKYRENPEFDFRYLSMAMSHRQV